MVFVYFCLFSAFLMNNFIFVERDAWALMKEEYNLLNRDV